MHINFDLLSPRQHVIVVATRLATLMYHSDFTADEVVIVAVEHADAATDGKRFAELSDLAYSIVSHVTDPERLAVERIHAAMLNKVGIPRLLAAYRANAGVLHPSDVERLAAE